MKALDIIRKISVGLMNLFHLLLSGLGFLSVFAYSVFMGLMVGIGLGVKIKAYSELMIALIILGTFALIVIASSLLIIIVIIPYWGFSVITAILAIVHKKPSRKLCFSIINSLTALVFGVIVSGLGIFAVLALGFNIIAVIIGVGVFILFMIWAPLNIGLSIAADVPLMKKGNIEKEFVSESN